eukprot:Opistho-1_new@29285
MAQLLRRLGFVACSAARTQSAWKAPTLHHSPFAIFRGISARHLASSADAAPHAHKGNVFRRCLDAYNGALASRPIITKAVTSGVLFAVGDVIAQKISAGPDTPFDVGRLVRATTFGTVLLGPLSHFHFNLLQWIVVTRLRITGAAMPFAKVSGEGERGEWRERKSHARTRRL